MSSASQKCHYDTQKSTPSSALTFCLLEACPYRSRDRRSPLRRLRLFEFHHFITPANAHPHGSTHARELDERPRQGPGDKEASLRRGSRERVGRAHNTRPNNKEASEIPGRLKLMRTHDAAVKYESGQSNNSFSGIARGEAWATERDRRAMERSNRGTAQL